MCAAVVDDEPSLSRTLRNRHAERVEQRVVVFSGASTGREVVADDERVGPGQQAHRLQLTQYSLPTTREPEPRAREDQPEQRDGLQRFAWWKQCFVSEGSARTRVEQVDRHLARVERGELEREVDALLECLTHTEDAAGAQLHACVLGPPSGLHPVVPRVGGADRRIELAAGLEIVVVPPHTRGGEPLRLPAIEEPERARNLETGLVVYRVHGVDDLAEEPLFGPAHRDDDAELCRAGDPGRARRLDHLLEVQERVDVDTGVEPHRLRAEGAVLGAGAGLGVDQALELHLGTAVRETHPVRERDQVGELVERPGRDREHFVAGEGSMLVEEGPFSGGDRHDGGAYFQAGPGREIRHLRRILLAVAERIETGTVVVGAGLAGLTAARRLVDAGDDVVVVEARERVGGRTLNHTFADGTVVEVGGQWIGPTQRRMERLANELGLETFPTYDQGEHLLRFGSSQARYRGTIPPINPLVIADMAQAQARFDRMARRVPLETPWAATHADEWDTQTFETWIRRNAFTAKARALLRLYSAAVFAAEPGDFSLLHALFYTHSGGGIDMLAGTHGGAQQDRFVGGSQLVALGLAEQLADRVHLGTPVRRIEQRDDRVLVLGDGRLVVANRVIVAIPPTLAGRIIYDPPLPAFRDQLLQRLPAGSVIKCNVVYDTPFWRHDGLTGQATGDRGPVKVTFDNSPPSGAPGILLAFLEGGAARKLGRGSPAERRDAVIGSLVEFFGPRARTPVEYVELDWSAEEWTRGCYGAHFPTGVWTQYGKALREPVGRIHWAGAELATVWAGYMDGAVQSGERAAAEVLDAADRRPTARRAGARSGSTP